MQLLRRLQLGGGRCFSQGLKFAFQRLVCFMQITFDSFQHRIQPLLDVRDGLGSFFSCLSGGARRFNATLG